MDPEPGSPFGPCGPVSPFGPWNGAVEVARCERFVLDVAARQGAVLDIATGQRAVLDVLAGDQGRGVGAAAEHDEQAGGREDVGVGGVRPQLRKHRESFPAPTQRDRTSEEEDPPDASARLSASGATPWRRESTTAAGFCA